MNNNYDAFISYRHRRHDKAIAVKLQKLLEAYHPPKKVSCRNSDRIQRVFRDESELPTSGDLGTDIKKALEQSSYLIVVCSEETAKSTWCMQEIEYFKQLHDGKNDNILTLLVSGDPREVFPKVLCQETRQIRLDDGNEVIQQVEVEPLAANVVSDDTKTSLKKLKTEFLRIAAPILGCSYDDLYQRHQKRLIRNILMISSFIIFFLLAFSGIVFAQSSKISAQSRVISKKQTALEKAYTDITDANDKLNQANKELLNANDKLSSQIQKTLEQKTLAEKNKKEALSQAKIAKTNEQKALENLELAKEQTLLAQNNAQKARAQDLIAQARKKEAEANLKVAREQTALAIANKEKMQEQQLFRTVTYAKQLAEEGDRVQAAAVLNETYKHFNKKSSLYRTFQDQFEAAMSSALYCPGFSAYKILKQNDSIIAAAFSDNDSMVATASKDGTAIVWDTAKGNRRFTFRHDSAVKKVCFYKKYLITGTLLGTVYIWDTDQGKLYRKYKEALGYTDQSYIDKNYSDYLMERYGVTNLIYNQDIHAIVFSISGSDNKKYLSIIPFSGQRNKNFSNTDNVQKQQCFPLSGDFKLSDNGKYLYVNENNICSALFLDRFNALKSKSTNLSKMKVKLGKGDLSAESVTLDNSGNVYYIWWYSSEKQYINVVHLKTNRIIEQIESPLADAGYRVVPNSKSIKKFVLQQDYGISFIDNTQKNYYSSDKDIAFRMVDNLSVFVKYIPDSDYVLISYSGDKDTSCVYSQEGNKIAELTPVNGPLSCIAVSHDGNILLTASKGGKTILHQVKRSFPNSKKYKSTTSVSGLSDQYLTVKDNSLYNIRSGQILSTLSVSKKNHALIDCQISSNGKYILGSEGDYSTNELLLHIWDAKSGKIAGTLTAINSKINNKDDLEGFSASPNFKYIAVQIKNTVYVYSVKKNKIIDTYHVISSKLVISIMNDGSTLSTLNESNGSLKVVNLKTSAVIYNKTIQFYGNIRKAYIDLKNMRIIICSYIATDITTNCEVYSMNTGEKLFSLYDISGGDGQWEFSQDTEYAVSLEYYYTHTWRIPSLHEMIRDLKNYSAGYKLTAKERQSSGLNIFDQD